MIGLARACCLLPLLVAACAVQPKDPFLRAEDALQRDDLLRSLAAFDAVPVAHPRYPEARARASEVERRIRRCHEFILEALMLRGEWRDAEALAVLRRAQEQWSHQPGLDQWIETTEQRLKLFGAAAAAPAPVAPPTSPPAVPHVEVRAVQRADDAAEPIAAPPTGAPVERAPLPPRPEPVVVVSEPEPPVVEPPREVAPPPTAERAPDAPAPVVATPVAPSAVVPVGEDPVALGMVRVEARLARGELVEAVGDLVELARRHPDDRRVQRRLAPLLHQRALMRYGEGAVAQAIRDWQQVLELEPENERVRELLDRAQREQR